MILKINIKNDKKIEKTIHTYVCILGIIILGLLCNLKFQTYEFADKAKASGNAYYVRADGTALNKSAAVGPATDVSATMNLAVYHTQAFSPGDTIYFSALGGDYTTTTTVSYHRASIFPVSSGNELANINYIGLSDGIGGAKPLVDVSENALSATGINITSKNYVLVQNFRIKGSGGDDAIRFGENSGTSGAGYTINIRDVDVLSNYGASSGDNDCFGSGSATGETSQAELYNITATGCRPNPRTSGSHQSFTLHEYAKAKVYGANFSDSNHWYVGTLNTYAELYNITASSTYGAGIDIAGVSGQVYVYNSHLTSDVGGSAFGSTAGLVQIENSTIISTLSKDNFVRATLKLINNNITVNDPNWRLTNYGGDAYFIGNNINITRINSYFSRSDPIFGGQMFFENNTFTADDLLSSGYFYYGNSAIGGGWAINNVFNNFDTSSAPIRILDDTSPFNMYNNIFYDSESAPGAIDIRYDGDETEEIEVKNNIFYNITDSIAITAGSEPKVIVSYQDYYNSSDEGGEGSITCDPQLINPGTNFSLQRTSPLIDTGTEIAGVTTDILGNFIYGARDIGAYEYQPPYTIGTDIINIESGARIYGNGKFKSINAPGIAMANIKITPNGGAFTQTTSPILPWLDISISLWLNQDDYHKSWSESNAQAGLENTEHTIGDLENNKYYRITVDSSNNYLIGNDCYNYDEYFICKSNADGKIFFTYTGSYSTHIFDVYLAEISQIVELPKVGQN